MSKRKSNWSTCTEAMIWITRYRIEHPRTARGKYTVYELRREPLDCYSRTLHTFPYSIGSAKTLEEAQNLAEAHEAAKRDSDPESASA